MKFSVFTKSMPVHDTWWPEHRGFILKIYKNTVHVSYPSRDDVWIYDKQHAEEFLSKSS